MTFQTIEYAVAQGVATIALNRPHKRNALDGVMRKELLQAIDAAMDDDAVRALVLTGRGGHFCAGGDISSMTPDAVPDAAAGRSRMRAAAPLVERLERSEKPIIAAVDGSAYGAGFSIALLADLIIATPAARFCMSFLRVGLVPDCGALYTLPRLVGLARARQLMLTTRELDAATALDWGLVTEVVPAPEIAARVQAMGAALASASPAAIALTRCGLAQSLGSTLPGLLEYEATAQGTAYTSAGHREAVRRFLAREPALFQWPAAR
ncbi:enoyl-CoA hydratase/isomerase family protein [Verticiella sediminum]|uniref:Enoyl-CoA hydratase/isomerase family protein n=1 Tax=Verticiella sediminum TaxID=1247510 RepID=A0A556B071_9BURK|nr:enoyl-CoA hydratase/isomerase family protein [Verticiella sediminum]TSH98578.1 enoyl-CoA hydratase/isomerase family protein [Verticiella sediminum]